MAGMQWLAGVACAELQSLSGQFSEEIVRSWSKLGSQYVTEYSNSVALATVTLASAGLSATDKDIVEDVLCHAEYLLDNMDDIEGEDIPTTEDILDMDVDELDSDDDVSTERFSRLVAE